MRASMMQIRKEVQTFIVATEQLYKALAGGKSLNVHEAEAVECCMVELLAKGHGGQFPDLISRSPGASLRFPTRTGGVHNRRA